MVKEGLIIPVIGVTTYLAIKGIEKAIVEPVMEYVTRAAYKKYLTPIWHRLDEQLLFPGELESFFSLGKEWLDRRVIPQEVKESLDAVALEELKDYLLKEFDVTKHLEVRHRQPEGLGSDNNPHKDYLRYK